MSLASAASAAQKPETALRNYTGAAELAEQEEICSPLDGLEQYFRFVGKNHSGSQMSAPIHSPALAERLEQFQQACRQGGVKVTPQRLEIFREIAASLDHPDAERVFRGVKARMPTVALDTVYRTLWMLADMGFITTLGTRYESVRFDANLRPHHHFLCVECGRAVDLETPLVDPTQLAEATRGLGVVHSTQVELKGRCNRCLMTAQAPTPS